MDEIDVKRGRFPWYCDNCGCLNHSNVAFLEPSTRCVECGVIHDIIELQEYAQQYIMPAYYEKALSIRVELLDRKADDPLFEIKFPIRIKGYGKIINRMQLYVFIRAMEGVMHSYKDLMIYSQALESKIEILSHPVNDEPLYEPEKDEPIPDLP